MKTTFNNIEHIIKRLVEYQVKCWCTDVRWDGSTKLLPMHPLSVAKNMAYECGWSQDDFHGRSKEITAHMRPYNQIKELNNRMGIDIVYKADQDSLYNTYVPRYVFNDRGEKVCISLSQYFDEGYGDDTVFLFLVENDYVDDEPISVETSNDGNLKVISKQKETDEERDARHAKEEKEKDEQAIRNGVVVAAIEMSASVWGREYHYCSGESEQYKWNDFRSSVDEQFASGESECGAYRNTVTDERVKWTLDCIDDVIELYKRYALTHLDDKRFMETLVKDLPKFSLFKNADDFELYEENWKKVCNYEKTLKWPSRVEL